jgi:endoglucanase
MRPPAIAQHSTAGPVRAITACSALVVSLLLTCTPAHGAKPYVEVSGNHLVNKKHETVRLLGVDRSGSEYLCLGGTQIFDGPVDKDAATAMAAWHMTAVRVPLNEDCWLGINGLSAKTSGVNYQKAIEKYVKVLQGRGLAVILSLQSAAPGTHVSGCYEEGEGCLYPMADAEHAPSFWKSVATAFAKNHGVVFDLYNEPYITSWECWLHGCSTTYTPPPAHKAPNVTYQTAGMQSLVEAVRSTGDSQVLMLGGLDYSSDETGWLSHEPTDPDHQLAASFHTYDDTNCNTEECWNETIAPLAEHVPVVTGEFGDFGCVDTYIDEYMPWADAHGISYLAWTWNSTGPPSYWSCSEGPALIENYEGTPTEYGIGLKEHLAEL